MRLWAKCFNPNVLSQLFISDRGLRTGPSVVRPGGSPRPELGTKARRVVRGKDMTPDRVGKPPNTSVVSPNQDLDLQQTPSVLWQ